MDSKRDTEPPLSPGEWLRMLVISGERPWRFWPKESKSPANQKDQPPSEPLEKPIVSIHGKDVDDDSLKKKAA